MQDPKNPTAISPPANAAKSKEQHHVRHDPEPHRRQGRLQEGDGRWPPLRRHPQREQAHPGRLAGRGRRSRRALTRRSRERGQGPSGVDLHRRGLHREAHPPNLGLAPSLQVPHPRQGQGQAHRRGEDRPRRGPPGRDEGRRSAVRGEGPGEAAPPPFSGLESLQAGQRSENEAGTGHHQQALHGLRRHRQGWLCGKHPVQRLPGQGLRSRLQLRSGSSGPASGLQVPTLKHPTTAKEHKVEKLIFKTRGGWNFQWCPDGDALERAEILRRMGWQVWIVPMARWASPGRSATDPGWQGRSPVHKPK